MARGCQIEPVEPRERKAVCRADHGGFGWIRYLEVPKPELEKTPFCRHTLERERLKMWRESQRFAGHTDPVRALERSLNRGCARNRIHRRPGIRIWIVVVELVVKIVFLRGWRDIQQRRIYRCKVFQ